MYAVLKTGGKQYRVEKEDVVLVEKLDANDGDQVVLDNILMIGEGKKVTLGKYFTGQKPVYLMLIYYDCPTLCNTHLNTLITIAG